MYTISLAFLLGVLSVSVSATNFWSGECSDVDDKDIVHHEVFQKKYGLFAYQTHTVSCFIYSFIKISF